MNYRTAVNFFAPTPIDSTQRQFGALIYPTPGI